MAQGGSGLSRFSPFNLFYDEISSASDGEKNQAKAMQLWNNLDSDTRRYYKLKSENIKGGFHRGRRTGVGF